MSAVLQAEVTKVSVLGRESIHCGFELGAYLAHTVVSSLPSSAYVIITDTNIAKHHLKSYEDHFREAIQQHGGVTRLLSYVIAPGETSKSREGKALIEDFLLNERCTRDTVLITMGGGVIGDLGGFVAATFMRGVRFVQVPTTLLAMVDSSVGGKTAIDTPHGKNLIGSFWQPEYVFIDGAFLQTLPFREFSNGMAEVVKTAAIWDEKEFEKLESRSEEVTLAITYKPGQGQDLSAEDLAAARRLLMSVIVGSVAVKAHIVTIDERETGLRNLVNFGHTIGHALEAVLTPTILHGEAVAVGIVLEAEVARHIGALNQVAIGRLTTCLKAYGLPVSVMDPRIASLPVAKQLTADRLLDIMRIDKKNSGAEKKVVILDRIGHTLEQKATTISDDVLRFVLSHAVEVVAGPPKPSFTMSTPGSKSISNRALVMAALGKGECRIRNLLHSDDTKVMLLALQSLKGATFQWEDNGDTLVVQGGGGHLESLPAGSELYLGNAGTASRFLTSVAALVRSPLDSETVLTGNARMQQRPIGPLVDALRTNGLSIRYEKTNGSLPIAVKSTKDGLPGGKIQLAASVSSQYVSSILMCAPYARSPVTLELSGGQVISQPYIDMTIAMMKAFGISVVRESGADGVPKDVYHIPCGTYSNPSEYFIESDASSATYPLAIAAITGTTCTIRNIGSASLQGDAKFAIDVLRPMGCTVEQTQNETTVTGPARGGLQPLGRVDMESMTDAFLTASVLAAIAAPNASQSVTEIYGIANQRVKECNRIEAMRVQLAKFGVKCRETSDGLVIEGRPLSKIRKGVSVHCYDDHRVAMSFSVLATVTEGTIIEEKRCVEKTWPAWWDDLASKIGIAVVGQALPPQTASASQDLSGASVFLVGMRGAGKSHVGQMAAAALKWSLIDADAALEQKVGRSVSNYVAENGWSAFREREYEVLQELLQSNGREHIISLGGGIVETPSCRKLLEAYSAAGKGVVYVQRDAAEVDRYLQNETSRPSWGEPFEVVLSRRQPLFHSVSNYDFVNIFGAASQSRPTPWSTDKDKKSTTGNSTEIARYFRHITGVSKNVVDLQKAGGRTYFVSLTYSDLAESTGLLPQLTEGADAVELRVDLLVDPLNPHELPSQSFVTAQLSLLRANTDLPIIFTVRTVSEGGKWPDTAEDLALDMMILAARNGIEYIDVQLSWKAPIWHKILLQKQAAQIIASYHNLDGSFKWNSAKASEIYRKGAAVGDIVKIVAMATEFSDNHTLEDFRGRTSELSIPFIGINMGQIGQLSRILNKILSPLYHPVMATRAAPGQLSFVEIQQALHLIGLSSAQRFYLLGTPIQQSPSPTLHNTGFQCLCLPHKYELLETLTLDDTVVSAIRSADFGGASVTIPHKVTVMSLLDEIDPVAKRIGAVNTVIPRQSDGRTILFGANTDWYAIYSLVKFNMQPNRASNTHALVIGAGGTARAAIHALHEFGANPILLYNRTEEAANGLKEWFPQAYNIQVVRSLEHIPEVSVVISTVPASALALAPQTGSLLLPESILNGEGGVIIDMAYKPFQTPLLILGERVNQKRRSNWIPVPGVAVLLEQGYKQFELWTGCRAPRLPVQDKVWEFYQSTQK